MSSRLLVVDDDAALNLAPCAHFEDRGWRATGVYDCAAAVAATAGANFEVVLLDVHLPDGDGVELLDRLLERDPHLPVILTTRGRDVERAMVAGFLAIFPDGCTRDLVEAHSGPNWAAAKG